MWDEGEEGPFQDTEFADMPKKQQKAAKVLGAHPAGSGAPRGRALCKPPTSGPRAGAAPEAGSRIRSTAAGPWRAPQEKRLATQRVARCCRWEWTDSPLTRALVAGYSAEEWDEEEEETDEEGEEEGEEGEEEGEEEPAAEEEPAVEEEPAAEVLAPPRRRLRRLRRVSLMGWRPVALPADVPAR